MSKPPPISRIEELRAAVSKADPHTYLVEARVMRRLIRGLLDRPNLAMLLPHGQSQILSKEQVQTLTHPDELGIRSWDLFPDLAILIEQPTQEELEHWPIEDLKLQVSRRLFHALLDRELLRFKAPDQLSFIQARIDAVGQVEFDEAHHVLRSELRLLQPDSRVGAFCEWVAHFWEFKKFEPDSLSTWFPSISSNAHVQESLRLGLDIEGLYRGSHLVGSAQPDTTDHEAQDEEVLKNTRKGWIFEFGNAASERKYLRYMRRRDRSIDKGNTVRAITSDLRAARVAPSRSKHAKAESMAESDLRLFVKRLREAIGFSHEESIEWQHVLGELAQNAVQGFWNAEKRLLYDLQKVCLDKERVVYRIDLLRWLASGGKRPLRTPLLNLSEVQMAKHLASAASRLVHVRLSGIEREQLTHLLENAAHQAELQMRNRIRGPLRETLLDVGMVPTTFPEKIALNKLVEDALDCISERGYISMGYFRDAVSKNDLKLPDLNGFREAWSGDRLLKADERLDRVLEGVYRRGDFYLRWIQMISAMFFGTKLGRFLTLFLIIPFGGALVVIESARHVWHLVSGWLGGHHHSVAQTETVDTDSNSWDASATSKSDISGKATGIDSPQTLLSKIREGLGMPNLSLDGNQTTDVVKDQDPLSGPISNQADENGSNWSDISGFGSLQQETPDGMVLVPPKTTDQAVDQIVTNQMNIIPLVILLGFFLMGLIHLPNFRRFCWKSIRWVGLTLYAILVTLPRKYLPWKWITRVLRASITQSFWAFVLKPALIVIGLEWIASPLFRSSGMQGYRMFAEGILLSALVNTRLGRDIQELFVEGIGVLWNIFRLRWFFVIVDWIVDTFRWLLLSFERFMYAVDEWLRFHNKESLVSVVAKAVLGFFWSIFSFLIRIYINLLIEPTFHPVKHFPVVTVAHKILLPMLLILAVNMEVFLSRYIGKPLAMSFTWFNVFFLPGFFGFAVWELKENWRLYKQNRRNLLEPVPIGSHGETMERLLRPGFHSGTLPKIFRRYRRLENLPASYKRFAKRRATIKMLHHVTESVHRFVDRELIALLNERPCLTDQRFHCLDVEASTNSVTIRICMETRVEGKLRDTKLESNWIQLTSNHYGGMGTDSAMELVIQEQSGWIVAWNRRCGFLESITDEQRRVFELATEGFFRKAGVFFIRSQVESEYTKQQPYDIQDHGLVVWTDRDFRSECFVHLDGPQVKSLQPRDIAKRFGLERVPDSRWIFAASQTSWQDWVAAWETNTHAGKLQGLLSTPTEGSLE